METDTKGRDVVSALAILSAALSLRLRSENVTARGVQSLALSSVRNAGAAWLQPRYPPPTALLPGKGANPGAPMVLALPEKAAPAGDGSPTGAQFRERLVRAVIGLCRPFCFGGLKPIARLNFALRCLLNSQSRSQRRSALAIYPTGYRGM